MLWCSAFVEEFLSDSDADCLRLVLCKSDSTACLCFYLELLVSLFIRSHLLSVDVHTNTTQTNICCCLHYRPDWYVKHKSYFIPVCFCLFRYLSVRLLFCYTQTLYFTVTSGSQSSLRPIGFVCLSGRQERKYSEVGGEIQNKSLQHSLLLNELKVTTSAFLWKPPVLGNAGAFFWYLHVNNKPSLIKHPVRWRKRVGGWGGGVCTL